MASPIDNGIVAKTSPALSEINTDDEKHLHEKPSVHAIATGLSDKSGSDDDANSDNAILNTAEGAVAHLLPLRDDFEPTLTFRSLFLASCLASFQAAMSQIYSVSSLSLPVCASLTQLILTR